MSSVPQNQERSTVPRGSNEPHDTSFNNASNTPQPQINGPPMPLYLYPHNAHIPGVTLMNGYMSNGYPPPPMMNFMTYPPQPYLGTPNVNTPMCAFPPSQYPSLHSNNNFYPPHATTTPPTPVVNGVTSSAANDTQDTSATLEQSPNTSSTGTLNSNFNDKNFETESEHESDLEHVDETIESKDAELLSFLINRENSKARNPEPTSNMDLLLQASIEAASYEAHKTEAFKEAADIRVETYIRGAIRKVQKLHREYTTKDLKPIDRKSLPEVKARGWSRVKTINSKPEMRKECRKLIRGIQGCGKDCSSKFQTLLVFADHVDKNHDIGFRPFLCPKEMCPWSVIGFHERSECTRHIRTKHYKAMYACDFAGCDKVYSRSDAFRRHVRQAHTTTDNKANSNSEDSS